MLTQVLDAARASKRKCRGGLRALSRIHDAFQLVSPHCGVFLIEHGASD